MPRSIAGLVAVFLLLSCMAGQPARAQDVPPAAVQPVWERTLYKTLTYQAMANVSDVLLYEILIGGTTAAAAGGFFAANAASAALLYFGFEYLWQTNGPPLEETTERTLLGKTVLYRAINSSRNFALGYSFSGDAVVAGTFVIANFVTDTMLFVGNEYTWDILPPNEPE